MKTKSPAKQSPIKKAKDALKHNNPKNPKGGSPKHTPKSPKLQNAKSPAKAKLNKTPVMNAPSDSEDSSSEAPKVAPFAGTAALGDAAKTPVKGKKNKTPPTTVDKVTPAKKAKTSASNKVMKKLDAKKKDQKKRVSLVHTVSDLMHKKDLAKLKQLLPNIDAAIGKLQGTGSVSAKRKLRLLMRHKSKIESENLEPTVLPVSKKKNNPKKNIPKALINVEEDDGKTLAEKLQEVGSDDDDDDDDEEEEDSDAEEEKMDAVQPAKQAKGKKTEAAKKPEVAKKPEAAKKAEAPTPKPSEKKRFVLFVGNLSYDTNEEKIKQHFGKAGNVIDVRLGKDKENKCKGFCFIEFANETGYQKGLSLHHTILDTRQINVEYSQGKNEKSPAGGNKKRDPKIKDKKLKGMMKKGMLAGSTKESEKRSVRRKKAAGKKA